MFSFSERIHTELFQSVVKKGRNYHSPLFSLVYLASENKAFSVVASKKVSKSAVVRNRNKRRVRHLIVKIAPSLPQGFYIVFIKRDVKEFSHQALFEELQRLTSTV